MQISVDSRQIPVTIPPKDTEDTEKKELNPDSGKSIYGVGANIRKILHLLRDCKLKHCSWRKWFAGERQLKSLSTDSSGGEEAHDFNRGYPNERIPATDLSVFRSGT